MNGRGFPDIYNIQSPQTFKHFRLVKNVPCEPTIEMATAHRDPDVIDKIVDEALERVHKNDPEFLKDSLLPKRSNCV